MICKTPTKKLFRDYLGDNKVGRLPVMGGGMDMLCHLTKDTAMIASPAHDAKTKGANL